MTWRETTTGDSPIGWVPADDQQEGTEALADLIVSTCIENPHEFAHAEVPAEGRVYIYCRNCGEIRPLSEGG